jgi:hypothetical protein
LDLAHRVIDVVEEQTSHGIQNHEQFGDAMFKELCTFILDNKFLSHEHNRNVQISNLQLVGEFHSEMNQHCRIIL